MSPQLRTPGAGRPCGPASARRTPARNALTQPEPQRTSTPDLVRCTSHAGSRAHLAPCPLAFCRRLHCPLPSPGRVHPACNQFPANLAPCLPVPRPRACRFHQQHPQLSGAAYAEFVSLRDGFGHSIQLMIEYLADTRAVVESASSPLVAALAGALSWTHSLRPSCTDPGMSPRRTRSATESRAYELEA